jgi:putative peptidoglycan lipid II flippase
MALQVPAIRAERISLRPRLALRDDDVREVFRLVPPLLVGSAVVNVNTLVDRAVGSAQGEGVITALSFGWRIVTLVDMLLVVTVVAALYPAFSRAGIEEDRTALRALVNRSARGILVVLAPVVALLVVAAEPIVTLLFGRGSFDADAIDMTATAVIAYAVAAVAIALRSIASRGCLAVGDSRSQVIAAVAAMAINVAGDLTLGVAYGIPGLAASTSISMIVGAGLLLVLLERRHDAVTVRSVAVAAFRVSVAATLGAAAVVLLGVTTSDGAAGVALLRCAAAAGVIAVVYVAVLVALRSDELREAGTIVRRGLLGAALRRSG